MSLAPGTKLGPYEILAPLGAGGMGEVYSARDRRLERSVAIKILPEHLSSDPTQKQRFEREAKAISSLTHPNICTLYDVGYQNAVDFLVMELLDGESLASRLEKGAMPLAQVLKTGREVSDALDKAHRSGVVHRDLKPGNIMLTATGAKLLDFGLAKPASPAATLATLSSVVPRDSAVTQEGTIVGTFRYMSPEQIEGKPLDGRTDIFSLGAVLYEMLTGRRAFEGNSQLSVASAILEKEPTRISVLKPMTPLSLEHTVHRCLAKDPDDRWQTARDLSQELKWIAESDSRPATSASGAPSQSSGKHYRALAAVVAFAALALGLAMGYFLHPAPQRRVVRSSILPPEKYSFIESGTAWGAVAVSPDGQDVVVGVQGESSEPQLYLRRLSEPSGQLLQGTEGASFPFWSPDSRSIAFFAYGQLKRIDATGGSTQVVCAASESRGGSWGPDGVIIFAPTITSGIFRVPDTGGTPVQISKLDASRHENSHRWPSFLPDGKHFLYLARTAALTDSAIRVGAIDGSESRVVVTATGNPVYARSGYLLYPQGSKMLAQKFDPASFSVSGDPAIILENVANNGNVQHASYSVSQNGMLLYHHGAGSGHSSLKVLDRSGKLLRVIDDSAAFFGPTLSPDATRVAVSATSDQNSSATDLWIYDLKTLTKTRFTFSSPSSADSSRLPVWSPDGLQLAFSSFRDGHYQIFVKSSNGVGPETAVYPGEGQRYAMSWSPDGHYLVVYEEGSQFNQGRMMVVPMTGGDEKAFPIRPELTTLTLFCMPRISPDGKWLTYMSNESGRAEVYLTTFPKGEGKWQVSTQGAVQPGWSRDGKELFFVNTQFRLQSVTIESKGASPVIQNVRDLFWAPLVLSASWTYDAFPGGQSFLLNATVNPLVSEPISLVENWESSLPKK